MQFTLRTVALFSIALTGVLANIQAPWPNVDADSHLERRDYAEVDADFDMDFSHLSRRDFAEAEAEMESHLARRSYADVDLDFEESHLERRAFDDMVHHLEARADKKRLDRQLKRLDSMRKEKADARKKLQDLEGKITRVKNSIEELGGHVPPNKHTIN